MKHALIAIAIAVALFATATQAARPTPPAPVDLNGDCRVSISDIVLSIQMFGNTDYATTFLISRYGDHGPRVCGFDFTPYIRAREW